jgi:integrase
MNLTKRLIDSFTYQGPEPRKDIRWDDQLPGFGVRVFASGRKAFVLSYRHQGRKRLITLGHYGVLTLDQARDRARRQVVAVRDGIDPLAERLKETQGQTLKDLATAYLERYARVFKKTWREDESRLSNLILPRWGSLKLTALKRSDIAALHQRIGAEHPHAANRLVELIARMYELARQWGFVEEDYPNPARRIQAFPETRRDRFVRADELPRLIEAIDAEDSPYSRAAFWLYLLTAMRKNELLRARWEDIDFDAGLWRLPVTKSARVHHIPLVPRVVAILKALPREQGNPHVLPGHRAGQPIINIDRVWRRIRARAGLADVRLHDLRRTAASYMAQDGASLHLIGKILNHRDPSTTAVYAHFHQQEARLALARHADRLFETAYASADGKVVSIRGRP